MVETKFRGGLTKRERAKEAHIKPGWSGKGSQKNTEGIRKTEMLVEGVLAKRKKRRDRQRPDISGGGGSRLSCWDSSHLRWRGTFRNKREGKPATFHLMSQQPSQGGEKLMVAKQANPTTRYWGREVSK